MNDTEKRLSHERTTGQFRLTRRLPAGAAPLVGAGDRVEPTTLIATGSARRRVLRLPPGGDFELLKKPGDPVKVGETVAVAEETLGLGLREYVSPLDGVVESVNPGRTAMVLTSGDDHVPALVPGVVAEVRPGEVRLDVAGQVVRGWFGFGEPVAAELRAVGELFTESGARRGLGGHVHGRIIWSDSFVHPSVIPALAGCGAAGLICGGIDFGPLWELIRPEGPHPAGLGLPALVVTQGFGVHRMDDHSRDTLAAAEGRVVYMAGPAQGRLVFARPPHAEVVVPTVG